MKYFKSIDYQSKTLRPSDKGWSQPSNQTHIGWCENYIDGWENKFIDHFRWLCCN